MFFLLTVLYCSVLDRALLFYFAACHSHCISILFFFVWTQSQLLLLRRSDEAQWKILSSIRGNAKCTLRSREGHSACAWGTSGPRVAAPTLPPSHSVPSCHVLSEHTEHELENLTTQSPCLIIIIILIDRLIPPFQYSQSVFVSVIRMKVSRLRDYSFFSCLWMKPWDCVQVVACEFQVSAFVFWSIWTLMCFVEPFKCLQSYWRLRIITHFKIN